MFGSFFLRFILKSKNRQGLLNLVFLGLTLSSMSLVILLGIMGGLQTNLKDRSKSIVGDMVAYVDLEELKSIQEIGTTLKEQKIPFSIEYEHEGLIKSQNAVIPVTLHGVYPLSTKFTIDNESLFPYELLSILGVSKYEELEFYSPSYIDSFFSDLPRSFTIKIGEIVSTRVPEIDSSHVWIKSSKLNNFIRGIRANRIRIFSPISKRDLLELLKSVLPGLRSTDIKSWNELHTSLVWALKLEKIMMTFLFFGMCFLVCLSISSAILVFIKKVNKDLTAMWILGASKDSIFKTSLAALNRLCVLSVFVGMGLGSAILFFIHHYSGNIMPDIFVERKIPVQINAMMFIVSFSIPVALSFIFVRFGLNEFKNETDYLKNVRSVGQD